MPLGVDGLLNKTVFFTNMIFEVVFIFVPHRVDVCQYDGFVMVILVHVALFYDSARPLEGHNTSRI